jgi:hypothetical protein
LNCRLLGCCPHKALFSSSHNGPVRQVAGPAALSPQRRTTELTVCSRRSLSGEGECLWKGLRSQGQMGSDCSQGLVNQPQIYWSAR